MRTKEQEYFHSRQYYRSIDAAASETMQIATMIFQDMMVHVFGLSDIHENVIWGATEDNKPAFSFSCLKTDQDRFDTFWKTVARVNLKPNNNVWLYDFNNKALSVNGLVHLSDLIAGIFTHYHEPRKKLVPIQPKTISSRLIKATDLKYVDNRGFLGEVDFQYSFKNAVKESATNVHRHYTYSLEDLDKSVQAYINTHDGILSYPTDSVFRLQ